MRIEIKCCSKHVKSILGREYKTVKSKLKINKETELSGWTNELIGHAGNDLGRSIFRCLIK